MLMGKYTESEQFGCPNKRVYDHCKSCLCSSYKNCVIKDLETIPPSDMLIIMEVMDIQLGHSKDQEKACRALYNLAYNNDDNQDTIVNAGGIEAILAAMETHPRVAKVQEKACWALLGVCWTSHARTCRVRHIGIVLMRLALQNHSTSKARVLFKLLYR